MMAEDVTLEDDDLGESADAEDAAEAKSVNPLRALRRHCLWCCNGSENEVRLCPAKGCSLWTFRFSHRPTEEGKAAAANVELYPLERRTSGAEFHQKAGTALKAIRLRCVDCSGGSQVAANACTDSVCDLHLLRKGRNPNFKISEERRQKLAASLSTVRAQKANGVRE
jgi:hypothetical protein